MDAAQTNVFNQEPWECPEPDFREVLYRLSHQNVTIVTNLETITGTLIRVKLNYVAVIESTSNMVLIPICKIQSITQE